MLFIIASMRNFPAGPLGILWLLVMCLFAGAWVGGYVWEQTEKKNKATSKYPFMHTCIGAFCKFCGVMLGLSISGGLLYLLWTSKFFGRLFR